MGQIQIVTIALDHQSKDRGKIKGYIVGWKKGKQSNVRNLNGMIMGWSRTK